MQSDIITFQLATHFLPKVALRLECLYETIQQACEETHPVIHHYALNNIIEIIKLIEKPELKSRFLKELMRIEHALIKTPDILSEDWHDNLNAQILRLTTVAGPFGEGIHHNPFLQSIRISLPSHTNDCETYAPQLRWWLASSPAMRQRNLTEWLSLLHTLQSTVSFYLNLLREKAQFNQIKLISGFYQRPLPPRTTCHLILLHIDKSFGMVPQMQLGHHGLSLRLCEASTMHEVRETDALLEIGICQI